MDIRELVSKIEHSMPGDTTLSVFTATIMVDMEYSPIRSIVSPYIMKLTSMIHSRPSLGMMQLKHIPYCISNGVCSDDA